MPRQTGPDLTLPLAEPITLTRGPRSHLVTLMDAAVLIRDMEPFRQARPVWDRAAADDPDCSEAPAKRPTLLKPCNTCSRAQSRKLAEELNPDLAVRPRPPFAEF